MVPGDGLAAESPGAGSKGVTEAPAGGIKISAPEGSASQKYNHSLRTLP